MFIITKTFTDDEGHLYTKVNPKQYSTPAEPISVLLLLKQTAQQSLLRIWRHATKKFPS